MQTLRRRAGDDMTCAYAASIAVGDLAECRLGGEPRIDARGRLGAYGDTGRRRHEFTLLHAALSAY